MRYAIEFWHHTVACKPLVLFGKTVLAFWRFWHGPPSVCVIDTSKKMTLTQDKTAKTHFESLMITNTLKYNGKFEWGFGSSFGLWRIGI
jgi:hypothetical protein